MSNVLQSLVFSTGIASTIYMTMQSGSYPTVSALDESYRVRSAKVPRTMVHRRLQRLFSRSNRKEQKLGYYQSVFQSNIESGNFNLLTPGVTEMNLSDGSLVTFRHMDVFLPLLAQFPEYGIEHAVGLLMAIHHFNNRIPTVLPILGELDTCNVLFSVDFINTMGSPFLASSEFVDRVFTQGSQTISDADAVKHTTAILGEFLSSVSQPLAIMSGIQKVTQVSFGSSSTDLDNKDVYPYFGRIVTSVNATAYRAVSYYRYQLSATHLFVIYTRDSFGIDYARSLQQHASALKIVIRLISISPTCTDPTICSDFQNALQDLRKSDIRYIFAILQDSFYGHYRTLIPMAKKEGLIGNDYFWTFAYSFGGEIDADEDLAIATNGSATIRSVEGDRLEKFEAYTKEWQRLMLSQQGRKNVDDTLLIAMNSTGQLDLFKEYIIPEVSTVSVFIYDAFMSLALASCTATAKYGNGFSRDEFHSTWLDSDFDGVTGKIRFDPTTGSRHEMTISSTLSNFIANSTPESSGKYKVIAYDTMLYQNGTWDHEQKLTEFLYANGGTIPPSNLPPLNLFIDEIQIWATSLGFLVTGITVMITLGFCVWMQLHRTDDPIRASQVFFVWMLGVGICLMSISIIPWATLPLSRNPNFSCMASPWLLSTGFCITFAALFSKLMRINQIDQSSKKMVRVNIKPSMVLKTFSIMLCLNLIILILWTIISPLRYTHFFTGGRDEFGRETSFAMFCYSDQAIWFRFMIGILDVFALILAFYQSWKARKVKMAYNESDLIFLALIISSQSFFIGVPGVVAASSTSSPTAEVMCRILAVAWGCLSVVLTLCVPKISQLKKWKKKKEEKAKRLEERRNRGKPSYSPIEDTSTPLARSAQKSSDVSSIQADKSGALQEVLQDGHEILCS
jgi:7 transmembrane sweet-taste receptor of 3 GCPR/Receptor family ligand binding region